LNDVNMFNLTSRMWVWVAGQTTLEPAGVYPTGQPPQIGGEPPGRSAAASWSDRRNGKSVFYIYGGAAASSDLFSDLWSFDTTTSQFTWWGGTRGAVMSTGKIGEPSATNTPGAISQSFAAVDYVGGAWIFLGTGRGTPFTNSIWFSSFLVFLLNPKLVFRNDRVEPPE
jgi:hypothetical protein